MKEPSDDLEHSTDVLVIGGGAAATEAAIRAADSGVDVILVDKKKYGRSGDSGQHPAGWHSASYLGAEGDNAEINLRDAVESGKWMINQKLVSQRSREIHCLMGQARRVCGTKAKQVKDQSSNFTLIREGTPKPTPVFSEQC